MPRLADEAATTPGEVDYSGFLRDHFRDVDGVVTSIAEHCGPDVGPKRETVRKWFVRNAVPADWLAVILAVLETDLGAPVSLAAYVGVSKPKEAVRTSHIEGTENEPTGIFA